MCVGYVVRINYLAWFPPVRCSYVAIVPGVDSRFFNGKPVRDHMVMKDAPFPPPFIVWRSDVVMCRRFFSDAGAEGGGGGVNHLP